jgi:uncharacterized OB-fold protein
MTMAADRPLTPIRKGLISEPIDSPEAFRLLGSKCGACGELSIGTNAVCLNCGGSDLSTVRLSPEGVLWTFTIVRHPPPGDYRGPKPFAPFGLGLIELPDGVRIMAPLDGDIDTFRIGARMRLTLKVLDADSPAPLAAFSFSMIG